MKQETKNKVIKVTNKVNAFAEKGLEVMKVIAFMGGCYAFGCMTGSFIKQIAKK